MNGPSPTAPNLHRALPARPVTVLQIVPRMDHGGVERAVVDFNRGLVAHGLRSILATSGGRLCDRVTEDGGVVVSLPVQSKNPLVMALNILRLRRLIRSEGVDVVHVRSRAPAFSAIAAARWTDVPIVSTCHGAHDARTAIKRAYNRILTRVDLVMVNSRYTHRHVLSEHRIPRSRMRLVPEAVDETRFSPNTADGRAVEDLRRTWSPDGRRILLCPGRLTRWKGQDLLIAAFARANVEGWRLVLAGDRQGRGAYARALEQLAERSGLGDRILFVGDLADMTPAYGACDAVALPSLKPESFGRVAVEAQLTGRPVIAADLGGFQETVTMGGLRLPVGDLDAWTMGLQAFLGRTREAHATLGEAARRFVSGVYALATTTAATLSCYAEVVDLAGGERREPLERWRGIAAALAAQGLGEETGQVLVVDRWGARGLKAGPPPEAPDLVLVASDVSAEAMTWIKRRLTGHGTIAVVDEGPWRHRRRRRGHWLDTGLYVSPEPVRMAGRALWLLTTVPARDVRPRDSIGRVATDYLRLAPLWLAAAGLG